MPKYRIKYSHGGRGGSENYGDFTWRVVSKKVEHDIADPKIIELAKVVRNESASLSIIDKRKKKGTFTIPISYIAALKRCDISISQKLFVRPSATPTAFTNITELSLSTGDSNGCLHYAFSSCPALQVITLKDGFAHLPGWLPHLKQLKELVVDKSNIVYFPHFLAKCPALQHIICSKTYQFISPIIVYHSAAQSFRIASEVKIEEGGQVTYPSTTEKPRLRIVTRRKRYFSQNTYQICNHIPFVTKGEYLADPSLLAFPYLIKETQGVAPVLPRIFRTKYAFFLDLHWIIVKMVYLLRSSAIRSAANLPIEILHLIVKQYVFSLEPIFFHPYFNTQIFPLALTWPMIFACEKM